MKRAFLMAAAIMSLFAVSDIYACNRGGYRSGGCGGGGYISGGCGSGGCGGGGYISGGCGSGGCGSGGCQPYYTYQPMYQPSVQRFRPMNQGCPDGGCNVRVSQPLPIQPSVEPQKTYNKKQVEMPSIRDFFE